jgi:hypothetical protein
MPQLTQSEYEATFFPPMLDVTATAEEIVDLWAYAAEVVDNQYADAGDWDWRVMFIYESRDGRFHRLNIPVPVNNTYLSVVVDKGSREILGHHLLDLVAAHPEWKSTTGPGSSNTERQDCAPLSSVSCPNCRDQGAEPGDA